MNLRYITCNIALRSNRDPVHDFQIHPPIQFRVHQFHMMAM